MLADGTRKVKCLASCLSSGGGSPKKAVLKPLKKKKKFTPIEKGSSSFLCLGCSCDLTGLSLASCDHQVSRWVPALNGTSDVPGFIQWKPVAYLEAQPTLEDTTPCHHSEPQPLSGQEVTAASGLVRAFYTDPEAFGLNMSFGLAGEPFYNSTRFLSWSV